ncbi:MAG: response regulator transcription factor [Deltaproteobacteria bacterium]|jgi:DNA-binding response OmpR family regulator|nr:response regulator transcription factor [Deltaproteobacteria bacterium]
MSPNPEAKILLVDDAARIRNRLEDFFESHNFGFMSLPNGQRTKEALAEFQPDLLLLDVMMPGPDGFELLRSIRATSAVPVIMLTARDSRSDRVKGLVDGADDYLGKPFHFSELLARIRAVLRRSQGPAEPRAESSQGLANLKSGPIQLDVGLRRLSVNLSSERHDKDLTNLEFRLFHYFMSRAGQILSRDELMGYLFDQRLGVLAHNLRVYVNRLRKILEELGADPRTIDTVWGSGYRWRA